MQIKTILYMWYAKSWIGSEPEKFSYCCCRFLSETFLFCSLVNQKIMYGQSSAIFSSISSFPRASLERTFFVELFVSVLIFNYCSAVVYIGFRGWGGGSRQAWGGYFFTLEKAKISHFFKLENFQKMLKNQWKFYNFFKIYM